MANVTVDLWILAGFVVVVVFRSAWLWRRNREYDEYIDEI